MAYDCKCWDLACDFLACEPPVINTRANQEALAQAIQKVIDDFIAEAQR